MSRITRTLIAFTASALVATAAAAQPGNFQGGGNGPATVKEVKLYFSGLNNGCPDEVALTTRVETTGPGNFQIRYRKAGGGKSGLITVTAVKTQNGKYVAKHVQPMTLTETTNTKYMVESGAKISPWIPVVKNCAVVLDPGIALPKQVLKAQLGIQGPKTTVCPNEAKVTGWIFTNYEGKVSIMLVRKGQNPGAPIELQTVKAPNGQYMATYSRTVPINNPINAEYRILVSGGGGVVSNWAPLKATCGMGLPNNELGG